MKVFVAGATGFIGSAIQKTLEHHGHHVIRGVRRIALDTDIAIDFFKDTRAHTWLPRLETVDAVINAVGLLGGTEQEMHTLHAHVPEALAQSCKTLGIKHFVQISALGVSANATTRYFRSKLSGEQRIVKALPSAHILRPSLVYGKNGDSSIMFRNLTRLPLLMLPQGGSMQMQPIHVNDVAALVNGLLTLHHPQILTALGPTPLSLSQYLASLAKQLRRKPPYILNLPMWIASSSAFVMQYLPQHVWTPDTLEMLLAGSSDKALDVEQLEALLARPLIAVEAFVNTPE